jgi:hypothetical protein
VFFLFGAGRLSLVHAQPELAIQYYTKAMEVQTQYRYVFLVPLFISLLTAFSPLRNMHHISYWEIALGHLALWQVEKSLENWRVLQEEATVCYLVLPSPFVSLMHCCFKWSKTTYSYGMAVCLLESLEHEDLSAEEKRKRKAEIESIMTKVPSLRQKIAGKSIPLEVCLPPRIPLIILTFLVEICLAEGSQVPLPRS